MSMHFAAPTLTHAAPAQDDCVTVQLSQLPDILTVQVPDSSDFAANWSVYAILGSDAEDPEWEGDEVDTGAWDDSEDEMENVRHRGATAERGAATVSEPRGGAEVQISG